MSTFNTSDSAVSEQPMKRNSNILWGVVKQLLYLTIAIAALAFLMTIPPY